MKPATDNIPHTINAAGVKEEARRLGFHACGLSSASEVDGSHAAFFDRWLASGRHAGMQYMERYRKIRHDPRLLMENTRTIVSVAMAYRPQKELAPHNPQIAWYAYGKDYHLLVGQRLRELLVRLQARYGTQLHGRATCDTAPLLERYWAWRAGLGWIGKHTQLVIPHAGSAFFLGELLLDAEADTYDTPLPNQCGQCNRCIEACPAQAIDGRNGLNANTCLSYLTIENRETTLSPQVAGQLRPYIYGCDRCLKACPHLKGAPATTETWFAPAEELFGMTGERWQQLSPEDYRRLFKDSAVKRAKYEGLMRNIATLSSSEDS